MPRQHAGLLVSRLDQAVADAAMLGAFAERKDVSAEVSQMIVDHDAAVDGNARVFRKRDVRPDAGGEDHGIGLDPPSVGELDAFDMAVAVDARGVGVEQHVDALALDQRLQQISRRRIELALHQPVHQMQQRHRRAGFREAIGRFESEQSAADHDDALLARGERQQQIDIAAVAEGVHARRDRRPAR